MSLFRDLLIEKKRKPYYCEVEYLESTGTQYIDTGYTPKPTSTYKSTFQLTNITTTSGNWFCVFGSVESNNSTFTELFLPRSSGGGDVNQILAGSHNSTYLRTDYPWAVNTKYNFEMNPTSVLVNGVSQGSISVDSSITCSHSIYLFARHEYNDAVRYNVSAKIHSFIIYEGNMLVRDLTPCLDWSMTPCMYDKVSGKLFYNAGTGDFTHGREIHYVDYLESDGTQYINTGVTLTNNHSVEIDYQLTSASQNRKGIFGGLVTNGSRFGALLSPSNNYLEFGYGSTNVWYQTGLPDTKRHIMKQQKNLLYFDGALIYTFETATFTQSFTAPLGNFNYTNYNPASAKYYSSKWWDNDTLVRDYLPAIDENGVGFMFDRVTHTIFDNAGTGAFKYSAREIEYLSSTGTQYIDTGFMPNQDTKIEVVGKFTNSYPACLYATRWSQSPTYDTYGGYAENNSQGMLYTYYGRYSDGNFIGVSNATFPYRDGNFIKFIQDKNKLDFTNLGTNDNWTYTFNETTFQSTRSLTLFYFSSSSSFATRGGTIKTTKIWDNGTLTRNYVSAYKDGALGLYDKANDVFYPNEGSGTFTGGKIIESRWF